jgi:hypothetical protein
MLLTLLLLASQGWVRWSCCVLTAWPVMWTTHKQTAPTSLTHQQQEQQQRRGLCLALNCQGRTSRKEVLTQQLGSSCMDLSCLLQLAKKQQELLLVLARL